MEQQAGKSIGHREYCFAGKDFHEEGTEQEGIGVVITAAALSVVDAAGVVAGGAFLEEGAWGREEGMGACGRKWKL